MKKPLAKAFRLTRDILIAVFSIFLGFVYLTRAWPRLEMLFGLFFVLAGMLIAMKINIKPFADLSPKATLAAYFSRKAANGGSRRSQFQRMGLVFLAIPILFFTPVVLVVGDVDKMQGYMAVSFAVFVFSIFFTAAGGALALRNWLKGHWN